MNAQRCAALVLACLLSAAPSSQAASFWERLGLKRSGAEKAAAALGLSEEEITQGLKAALDKGVQSAVATLSRDGGFLQDAAVRIPLPESLNTVERGLRAVGQGPLADEFVATMNRAAEKAVPQAAEVLGQSIRQMTLSDVQTILTATNNAATEYFRRTSQTNLQTRLRPIIAEATEKTGVTAAYKAMTARTGALGALFGPQAMDLDGYVTDKALDGLFVKIADEERRIRENPAARTSEILQKVFGAAGVSRPASPR